MEKIEIVVKVDALQCRGNKSMAVQYVRDAVRGWKGQYMPDDSRVELYDWDKAAVTGASEPSNWKARLVREQADLAKKIRKLAGFFNTPSFLMLAPSKQRQLVAQLNAMREYQKILRKRIAG